MRLSLYIIAIAINLTLGVMSVRFDALILFGKSLPLIVALLLGLIGGQFTLPLAVCLWILQATHIIGAGPLL